MRSHVHHIHVELDALRSTVGFVTIENVNLEVGTAIHNVAVLVPQVLLQQVPRLVVVLQVMRGQVRSIFDRHVLERELLVTE